jgi:hypothetical protein
MDETSEKQKLNDCCPSDSSNQGCCSSNDEGSQKSRIPAGKTKKIISLLIISAAIVAGAYSLAKKVPCLSDKSNSCLNSSSQRKCNKPCDDKQKDF